MEGIKFIHRILAGLHYYNEGFKDLISLVDLVLFIKSNLPGLRPNPVMRAHGLNK